MLELLENLGKEVEGKWDKLSSVKQHHAKTYFN